MIRIISCCCLLLVTLLIPDTSGRPIDKRSVIGDLKHQAITYLKGIPARWREFIPDEIYQKGIKKWNEIKDKMEHMFEGDISGIGINGQGNQNAVLSDAGNMDERYLWPSGTVPYTISSAFAPHEVEVIKGALDDIMKKTCIKFVERTNQVDYISVVRRNMGCSSYVARQGGQQFVDLQPGCIYELGEVQHEVMHALGFYHEQSRTDRDDHVSIVWDNVKSDQKDQFKKYVSNTFGLKYDYNSIMHYGWNYFALDATKPTILPKVKASIGNRNIMSNTDVEKINRMYKCPQANKQQQPALNIPQQWIATPEPNPDWHAVVTPAPGSAPVTRCFIPQANAVGTTESSGFLNGIFTSIKNAAKSQARNVVCNVING